eukprot:4749860-Alexandrium_andersonii.AAC.1
MEPRHTSQPRGNCPKKDTTASTEPPPVRAMADERASANGWPGTLPVGKTAPSVHGAEEFHALIFRRTASNPQVRINGNKS